MTRIAVVSDTHLGSRHQQLTSLKNFYQYAADKECESVYHAGDLCDGMFMRKGHEYECFVYGAGQLLNYILENYPRDLPTYFIGGNHDDTVYTRCGLDLIEDLCARCPESFHYLGTWNAFVRHGDISLYLNHRPGAGAACNRLYKAFNNVCKEHDRPDVVINGHLHNWCIIPDYGKIHSLLAQVGCFQGTTDYLRKMLLAPQIGGLILERHGDGSIQYEIKSYKELINDY